MSQVLWQSLEDGEKWVKANVGKWQRPCVILLIGGLGAGKTQVTKWIVQSLGSKEAVTSPTFGIHHRYDSPNGPIDHVDLYRLESPADLESTGFWDLFSETGFVIVEWADLLPKDVWPAKWQKVFLHLELQEGSGRVLRAQS